MYYLCTLKFPPPLSPSLSISNFLPLNTLNGQGAGLPRLTRKILCAPHGQQEQDLFSEFISNFPPLRCQRHKFMDRRAYMCLTTRTLAMTWKAASVVALVRAARATRTGFVFRIYLKFSAFKVPAAQVYGSPRVYVSDDTDARDDVESGKCGCTSARRTCIRAMCHERVVAWHQRGRAGGAGGGVSGVGAEEVVREGRVRSGREE